VLIGQKLNFSDTGKTIIGLTPDSIKGLTFGTTSTDYDSSILSAGTYNCSGNASGIADMSVSAPILTIDLKYGTTSVSSTTAGTNLTLDVNTNIPDGDAATIEVIDPDGNILGTDGDDQALKNVTMSLIKNFGLNTTGFKAGTYTIQVKTNVSAAEGLDMKSNILSLEIVSPDITISASKTSVVKGEKTTISLTAPAGDTVYVTTSPTGKVDVVENARSS